MTDSNTIVCNVVHSKKIKFAFFMHQLENFKQMQITVVQATVQTTIVQHSTVPLSLKLTTTVHWVQPTVVSHMTSTVHLTTGATITVDSTSSLTDSSAKVNKSTLISKYKILYLFIYIV